MSQVMIDRSSIGMVSILMGIAVVEGPDGLTRLLQVGSELHAGETVHVPGQGSVGLHFLDGREVFIESGQSLHLDPARWRAADMPLDEDHQVLRIQDVLLDEFTGDDLSAWLPLSGELGADEAGTATGMEEFPLNSTAQDLPGWYFGLGGVLAAMDSEDVYDREDVPPGTGLG